MYRFCGGSLVNYVMLGTIKVTVDAGIGWIHWEKRAEEDNSKFRRKYDDMIEETTLLMMGL